MKKGVTIIELVVVMAVTAILLMIAIPSISKIREKAQLNNIKESSKLFFEYGFYTDVEPMMEQNGYKIIRVDALLNEGFIDAPGLKDICDYDSSREGAEYDCSSSSLVYSSPFTNEIILTLYSYDRDNPSDSKVVIARKTKDEVMDATSLEEIATFS